MYVPLTVDEWLKLGVRWEEQEKGLGRKEQNNKQWDVACIPFVHNLNFLKIWTIICQHPGK